MKKWIALMLSALMLLGCACARADGGDGLAEVTLRVKERLGIGDGYEEFYSDSYEDAAGKVYWNLSWSGAQGSVYVTCDRQGNVFEYSRYDSEDAYEPWSSDFAPRLVEETEENYRPAAEAFLQENVDGEFGWRIESAQPIKRNYRVAEFSFAGRLTRGGYDTQVQLSVTVRVRDSVVTGFWRSDAYKVYTAFIAPETPVDAASARAALEAGLRMELRYVPDGKGKAALRYLPARDGSAFLDAATGEPFEPETEESAFFRPTSETQEGKGGMAADTGSRKLTEAELTGIEAAEGLMGSEELDARARAIAEFGLDEGYALSRASTFRDEDGRTLAMLRYQAKVDRETLRSVYRMSEGSLDSLGDVEDMLIMKAVCLDAANGELVSLSTSYPFYGGLFTYRERGDEEMRAAAEAFLGKYSPERFSRAAFCEITPCDGEKYWYDPAWTVHYDRVENGVPYKENSLVVSVNADTGLVDGFQSVWEEDIAFESTEGAIGADEARGIWLEQLEAVLRYVDSVDGAEGYDATCKSVLCYELRAEDGLLGVNARDGSLYREAKEGEGFVYDDVEGHPDREAIETLAAYGIGFPDGAFHPDEEIALRDWLKLLYQAGDYSWAVANGDDDLISLARSLGIPLPTDELDSAVTRLQAVRMLIGMSGYGKAAPLREAFVCGFADDSQVPDEDYGYLAIARAMGVAAAGADGAFRPLDSATRAEAAAMLLAFLTRSV